MKMLNSVVEVNKMYHRQTFLEKCKYEITEEKRENLINDDFESGSSDNESDNESDNDECND